MVKAQRATKEMEEGFWQEWEELEAERLRHSDWECHLRDHTQVVASRAAEERAQLERERDVQREKLRRVIDQEMVVARRSRRTWRCRRRSGPLLTQSTAPRLRRR
jgi:hypothetical protein